MPRPNVLIILADDLGYGDLSCQGCDDYRTPNLDRIAAEGVRFRQFYAASPVCSPSRAALLTGRHPINAGVPGNVAPDGPGLPASVPTLATALGEQGYNTYLAGKWHLGQFSPHLPGDHGVDEWFGFLRGCVDYYSHTFYWGLTRGRQACHDLWENGREIFRNGRYLTDLIVEYAVEYLRRAARAPEPFLLTVPFNAPHYPMQVPSDHLARFADLPADRQLTAAMVTYMDRCIGRILDELESLGLAGETCVFFQSDHGPSREPRNWPDGREEPFGGGQTGGLRGAKFDLYEGGIRVPALLRLPGVVPVGRVIDELTASIDMFPTLLHLAGGDPADFELDGLNLRGAICDGDRSPHEQLCWSHRDDLAIRRDNWKLIVRRDRAELYDLATDPGETDDQISHRPELAGQMMADLRRWQATLDPPI